MYFSVCSIHREYVLLIFLHIFSLSVQYAFNLRNSALYFFCSIKKERKKEKENENPQSIGLSGRFRNRVFA